jgi:hypothetical protein
MRAPAVRSVGGMNRNRLILVFFALLALLVPLGGPAYAGEESTAPPGPDLCDGSDCGPNPPPPPPPPPPPGEPPPPPPPPEEPSYVPMGWLDVINADGVAYGWACDPNNFWAPLEIHFYVDGPAGYGGTFIGAATANGWREQGVADMCGGNPYHGFAFTLPDSVRNGVQRSLYAYAINIGPWAHNPMLDGSPKSFTLGPPPPPAEFYYDDVPPAFEGKGDNGGYYSAVCPRNWKFGKELQRSQGRGVWARRLYLYVVWCSNSLSGHITKYTFSVRPSHGDWCASTHPPMARVTNGGAGWNFVDVQAWVEVECASVPFNWPKHHDTLMMRIRYFANGWYRLLEYD